MVMKLVTSNPRAISLYRISLIIPAWREHILVNILLVVLRYHFIGPAWVTCLCCCSVTKSCLPLCDPMDCSMPGFPVLHYLPVFAQTHVHWVSDAIKPSYSLSLPSLLALHLSSVRVFNNDSALHIRWPNYCSFSINPSNEYSGLISFRIDWFDLLTSQGTLKSLL